MKTRKKWSCLVALVLMLSLVFSCTVHAADTTAGYPISQEITTSNGDTAYIAVLGDGKVYIEVLSDGNIWQLDTANPFAATVCTVVDASGNELGTLESTDGIIDISTYPDADKIICTTDFTGDVYEVMAADVLSSGTGESAGAGAPSNTVESSDATEQGTAQSDNNVNDVLNKVMPVIYTASKVVMVLWAVIIVVTVAKCYKDGIFGAKRRAKKCPLNGIWDVKVTTPRGENDSVIVFTYDGNNLTGTLTDSINKNVPIYAGKVSGETFECLVKIDIGMGTASEFCIKGTIINSTIRGEMVLTAMDTIKSAFAGKKRG